MPGSAPAPRRSDATRAAIRDAARRRFAADGYERATIRAVAADAGIDPAMVMRYFGSKAGLFAAAAEFDLGLPDFRAVPRDRLGAAMVAHFLDRWEADDTFLALLRAAATNEAARERIRAVFSEQVAPAVAAVADGTDAATRAGLLASQFLGLALCRYVLALPPVAALGRDALVRRAGPVVQAILDGEA